MVATSPPVMAAAVRALRFSKRKARLAIRADAIGALSLGASLPPGTESVARTPPRSKNEIKGRPIGRPFPIGVPSMGKPKYLGDLWRQDEIPVLAQRAESKELFVRLPDMEDSALWRWQNRRWLRQVSPRGHIPKWSNQYRGWSIPKSWLTKMTRHLLQRYGHCYVVQPDRKSKK